MWYAVIIFLSLATFFLSPYEPLLQASNRERVLYKNIWKDFPLYGSKRIFLSTLGAVASCATYRIVNGAYFIGVFSLFFAALYASDFLEANRVAKRAKSSGK